MSRSWSCIAKRQRKGVWELGRAVRPNEVNQGREFDLIRLRIEDKRTARSTGQIEESRDSAGLRVLSPHRTAFLTK